MNKVLLAIVLLAAVYAFSAWSDPCRNPVTYRVGEVDSRFGLSRKQILAALRRAEDTWEDPVGRDLFRYDDEGSIAVNFVYDTRQLTAQTNARRKDEIDRASSTADEYKAKFDAVTAEYDKARKAYVKLEEGHDREVTEHNLEVKQWNVRGGATPAQLEQLRRRAAELQVLAAELDRKRTAVNALADRANSLSKHYNEVVREVRDTVEAVNETAGREFKQGRYVQTGGDERIDVFEYVSTNDLVHLLAHEFGHALGLEHDDDKTSIMYGVNSTEAVVLSPGDLTSIRARCRL